MRENFPKHCWERTGRLEDASLEMRLIPQGPFLGDFTSHESSAAPSSAQGEEWGRKCSQTQKRGPKRQVQPPKIPLTVLPAGMKSSNSHHQESAESTGGEMGSASPHRGSDNGCNPEGAPQTLLGALSEAGPCTAHSWCPSPIPPFFVPPCTLSSSLWHTAMGCTASCTLSPGQVHRPPLGEHFHPLLGGNAENMGKPQQVRKIV